MSRLLRPASRRGTILMLPLLLTLGCSGSDGEEEPHESDSKSPSTNADQRSGTVEIGADGLPESYPREDAPIIEGSVLSVVEPERSGEAFVIAIEVTGPPSSAVTAAVRRLEQAGWDSRTEVAGDPPPPQLLVKGDGEIVITNGLQRDERRRLLGKALLIDPE